MRLVLFDPDDQARTRFNPLGLSRPLWELRCGMADMRTRILRTLNPGSVAYFVPDYMAGVYRAGADGPVNDPSVLDGEDLLIAHSRVKPEFYGSLDISSASRIWADEDGAILVAWIRSGDLSALRRGSIDELLSSAQETLSTDPAAVPLWRYIWEFVLENPEQITRDFAAAGKSGIEGSIEEPSAIRGSSADVYVAPGATIHPMVVLDAEHGPIYLDEGVEVHPFTRIEGPCYVGPKSVLLGTKCREGMSIGPVCRVGGEVEESIIHGHSNKYHDGFLGHAYVGEWVNLGAFTTNSDLKNDYSSVTMTFDGHEYLDTQSTKVGAVIGDHTKTSVGTLFNTGAYVGAMCVISTTGTPLPKFIPSFSWFLQGVVTKGFGRRKLFETAAVVMGRRGEEWTSEQEALWEEVFTRTAPGRNEAVKKGRRVLAGK